ncbi:MAG: OmpA family protein [Lyngbya sp.]|nr:OmpA family protein [Lyngbya sp.]
MNRNFFEIETNEDIEDNQDSSVWLSIGDLMSGLLLFFALLFITVQVQLNEYVKKLDEKMAQVEKLSRELEQYQQAFKALPQIIINALEGKVGTKDTFTVDPATGDVSIRDRILFDDNSSVLKTEGKEFLKAFIPVYSEVVFSNSQFSEQISRIIIEGHTSSAGTPNRNMQLSLERALAVSNYILSNELNFSQQAEFQDKLLVSGRGEIDADQTQDNPGDRKVTFRFQFRRESLSID